MVIGSGSLLGFCPGWTNIVELFVRNINFFIFTRQQFRADGMLIPHLYKALPLRRTIAEMKRPVNRYNGFA